MRSYTRGDTVDYVADANERLRWWCIVSVRGAIGFHFLNYEDRYAGGLNQQTGKFSYFSDSAPDTGNVWDWAQSLPWQSSVSSGWFLAFGYGVVDSSWYTFRGICIPHWFLALLFAVLPALYLRAAIRSRKRRLRGQCPTCGYDLRATPERCPECGRVSDEFPNQKSE